MLPLVGVMQPARIRSCARIMLWYNRTLLVDPMSITTGGLSMPALAEAGWHVVVSLLGELEATGSPRPPGDPGADPMSEPPN